MINSADDSPFIMVDPHIITEGIFKFKNKWEGGMMLVQSELHEVAPFNEWVKATQDAEIECPNGKSIKITKQDWDNMRQAVRERDKRLKF